MRRFIILVGLLVVSTVLLPGTAEAEESLTLEQAIRLAVERNPSLETSRLNVFLAELAADRARLDRLSASIDVTAGDTASISWDPSESTDDQDIFGNSVNYGVSAALSVPLYSGGAVQANIKRSDVDVKIQETDMLASVRDLVKAVYESYWTIQGYDLQQSAVREALTQSQEAVDIIQAKLDAGLAAPIELNRFKVDVLNQEQTLAELEYAAYSARQTLFSLLHLEGESMTLTDEANGLQPNAWSEAVEDLIARAVAARPELKEIALSLEGSSFDRAIARAAFYPAISLDFTAQTAASPYWYDDTSREAAQFSPTVGLTAGINLQWNVFNNWKTRYSVRQVDVASKQLEAQRDAQRDAIVLGVKTAYHQLDSLKRRADGVREQLALAKDNLTIIQTLYSQGSASLLDLFDAQSAYRTALSQEATFRVDMALAEYELRWAVGDTFGTNEK